MPKSDGVPRLGSDEQFDRTILTDSAPTSYAWPRPRQIPGHDSPRPSILQQALRLTPCWPPRFTTRFPSAQSCENRSMVPRPHEPRHRGRRPSARRLGFSPHSVITLWIMHPISSVLDAILHRALKALSDFFFFLFFRHLLMTPPPFSFGFLSLPSFLSFFKISIHVCVIIRTPPSPFPPKGGGKKNTRV